MVDTLELRKVMGQFATGVTVITTSSSNNIFGFTANSYTSVSLDPPLVLFCLNKQSNGCSIFLENECFAVNILAKDQQMVSNGFANKLLSAEDRFELVQHVNGKTGSPLIDGTLGWLDCKLTTSIESGDHIIFIGEVVDVRHDATQTPLLYFQGNYREIQ